MPELPPGWVNQEPTVALPGATPSPLPVPSAVPPANQQPDPLTLAVVSAWNLRQTLAQLIAVLDAHPEIIAWAKASQEPTKVGT